MRPSGDHPHPLSFSTPCTAHMALKERMAPVGVLWDFSGIFGCIERHEREIAERPFPQVSG